MHVIYVISCQGRRRSAYLCGPPLSCSFHSSVYWPECLKVLETFFSWFLGPERSLCILHPTRRLSKSAACPQAHPRSYFAIYVAQGALLWGLQTPGLYLRKPCNGPSAPRFQLLPNLFWVSHSQPTISTPHFRTWLGKLDLFSKAIHSKS